MSKKKTPTKQITDWPKKTATRRNCLLIQWEGDYVKRDTVVCPRCHEPAEMVLGIMGNPCWAHKHEAAP